jgi:hypothetical protein
VVCCARGPTSSSSVLLLPHSAAAGVWRRGRRWRGGPSVAACPRRGAGRRSCPTLRRRRAVFWGRLRLPSAATSHPSSYSLSFAPTAPGCRVGGCPAGRARCGVEGTQRAVGWMSGDHDRCFSTLVPEAFRQVFFNANATVHHHRRRLVGRIGHHDRCSLTLVLVYSARRHGVCLGVYV